MKLKTYPWSYDQVLDSYSISNVEILETFSNDVRGKLDENDLDRIVAKFNELKEKKSLLPRLFVGHHGSETEREAGGYIEKIWRVGRYVFANFIDIPKKIFMQFVVNAKKKLPVLPFRSAELDVSREKLLGVALMKTAFPYMDLPMTAVENQEIELFSNVTQRNEVLCFSYACTENSMKGGIMPIEKEDEIKIPSGKIEEEENYQDTPQNPESPVLAGLARLESLLMQLLESKASGGNQMADEPDKKEDEEKSPSPNSVAGSENYSASHLLDERMYELAKKDYKSGVTALKAYRGCHSLEQKEKFFADYTETLKFQMPNQHRITQMSSITVPRQRSEDEAIIAKYPPEQEKLARAFLRNYRHSLEQRDNFHAKAFREQFPTPEKYIKAHLFDARCNPGKYEHLLREGV